MTAIYNFFLSILNWINGFVGSYGWSIVIFTILLRLLLSPLDYKSRKSMRKMTALQGKVERLRQKYADDQETLNRKTADLYKEEGASPLGGCLPLLLSWPILIAFFGMMRLLAGNEVMAMFEAAQANHGDIGQFFESFLWIKNIWQPDALNLPNLTTIPFLGSLFKGTVIPDGTQLSQYAALKGMAEEYMAVMAPYLEQFAGQHNGYFILPLLAGASQFLQMKLTTKKTAPQPTATPDGQPNPNMMQSKIMTYFFPLFSLWICSTYNAAFSIYWVASNLCMIAQQFILDKILDAQEAKKTDVIKAEKES